MAEPEPKYEALLHREGEPDRHGRVRTRACLRELAAQLKNAGHCARLRVRDGLMELYVMVRVCPALPLVGGGPGP